ncbi:hypothetical protein F4774DRAFT_375105 [Daldinia eschscholtzii]|nr:hypothetical protein F4774DRAFT_375105 [Daldinia eschscholtzii]
MSPLKSAMVQLLGSRSVDPNSFNSNSDIQNDYQNNSDRVHRTATAITTGWIVGIVFIVLSGIVALCLLLWMYNRNSRRRQERMAQLNAEPKYNGSQALGIPPQDISSPSTYGQPSELAGPYSPRYEAPDTSIGPREVPNNEVPRKPCEAHSVQRSELPV